MSYKISLMSYYNLYESKRYFCTKLNEAMQRFGIETQWIDLEEADLNVDTLQKIRYFEPDFICSFNSYTIHTGKYFWDYLKIPHVSFLVDPAFYSTKLTNSPYSIISCVDRSDCKVLASSGFKNTFFWPHAIEREMTYDPHAEKPYDIVLIGSCYDYEELRKEWQSIYSKPLQKLLDDAIDLVFSQETISLGDALVKAWNGSSVNPEGINFEQLYTYLDYYTRGKDRVELIRAIRNIPVHVFGDCNSDGIGGIHGWQHYLANQGNVKIHPGVPYKESLKLFQKAKIVLNSMPFFRDGTHERIFMSYGSGCLPITSESLYLREQFKDGEEILFYQAAHRGDVEALIRPWLENEARRQTAVKQGYDKVMQHHTWDQRVQQLMDVVPAIIKS